MNNLKLTFLIMVLLGAALASCATERYTPLGGGYGDIYKGSDMPHSSWSVGLVHDGPKGRKAVWKSLVAGHGGPIIHDSLIVFVGGMRGKEDWLSLDPYIFAALEGGPPVEITLYLSALATSKLPKAIGGQLELSEIKQDNGTGVSFCFATNLPSEGNQVAPVYLSLTWDDLKALVVSTRVTGKRASYAGVTYFKPTK